MNREKKSSFQAFRRIVAWIVAQPILMAQPMVAAFIMKLHAVLDELSGAAAAQDSHFRLAKGATAEAKSIRREVVQHMRLVARVAEISIPEVFKATASLQMPHRNLDTEGLVVAAMAIAGAAEANQDALAKQGLAADAIAQLRAAAERFKAAVDSRGQMIAQRRGATADVDVQLHRARKLVDALSILVARTLRDDPATLAEWEQLKRVTQKPGPLATTAGEAPATPVSVAGTPVLVPGTQGVKAA